MSTEVTGTVEGSVGLTGGEFGEVIGGDGIEVELEFGGEGGDIPEDVAEFSCEEGAAGWGDGAVFVTDSFFEFLANLAGFAGEAEGGVGIVSLAAAWVDGGGGGALLIFGEGGHRFSWGCGGACGRGFA